MRESKNHKNAKIQPQIAQPFSLQAEQAIIGALMSDPKETYYALGDKLLPEHFYDPFCRLAYSKSLELLSVNKTVDIVVLATLLDGIGILTGEEAAETLRSIYMVYPTTTNLTEWAEIIQEKAVQRNLTKTGQRLIEMAHAMDMSADEKIAEATRCISDVSGSTAKDDLISTESMVISTLEEIERNSEVGGQITGVATGLTELDQATTGFQPGDLIILAARPSMGKTALVLGMAQYVTARVPEAERAPILMFSLEMGVTQLGMRWLSALNNIPLQHLRSGRISPSEWAKLQHSVEEASVSTFSLDESGSITLDQIAAKARRKKRETGLSGIVIDYLQLITDSGRVGASKAERVGEISRGLKQLAKELKVPVIALSQLSRDVEKRQDKRPMMSDLRESGAIEQDADIIMFLYRDEYYNKTSTEVGIGEIIIGKQRNGPCLTIRTKFDNKTTTFANV